ncbi:hypothetical protein BH09PSE5_BH09PSE5_10630 [soil metagenome]
MRLARLLRPLATCISIAALASCATKVPLPPLPPLKPLPPLVINPPDQALPPAQPASAGALPPAETSPILSSPINAPGADGTQPRMSPDAQSQAAAAAAAIPDPPPYNAAVAARFPDPNVSYFTPAFEQGHDGYTTNGELHSFMQSLADRPATGTTIQLLNLGTSQRGAPLDALLFPRVPDSSPTSLLSSGRPTVLLIGQQHGNEPAGSEALIVIAQRLATPELQSLLDRINVLILPRANPDGAESNQRTTASGVDMNRDHLLLRTPESQAIAMLMREYKPMVVVDSHEYTVVGRYLEKFNAVQRYDALAQYAMTANLPEFLTKASEEWFRTPMIATLRRENLTSEWYYTTSTDLTDKKLSMGGAQPDTARNVQGLRNAVSILIETRGVGIGRMHLKRRVHTHVTALTSVLRSAAQRSGDLLKLRAYVDAEVSAKVCQGEAVVEAAATPSEYRVVMLDPVTGADKPMQVAWDSSLELTTVKRRARPCGYWLAASAADAVTKLRGLGVTVQQLQENGVVQGDAYREISRQQAERRDVRGTIADGGETVAVKVDLKSALMDVPSGSYYVGLDQPLASLVIATMEPDTQNSFVTGGVIPRVDQQARVTLPPNLRLAIVP